MERKKNARSLYVQQKCPTESSFKKTEMYDRAKQDLYVESSEVHNFDINRCDAEKQKKHIAANWVPHQ